MIGLAICGFGFGCMVFYLFRNSWVYRVRTDILKADYGAYKTLPEYDTMMRMFWIWDASRFLGMAQTEAGRRQAELDRQVFRGRKIIARKETPHDQDR